VTLAQVKQDRADLSASRRAQVLRRLRWAAPSGLGVSEVEDRLDWPRGTGASVLRELEERGEARQRGGCWYYVQGQGSPRPVAAVGAAAGHTSSNPPASPSPPTLRGHRGSPRLVQVVEIVRQHPGGLSPSEIAVLAGCAVDAACAALRTARRIGLVRAEGATTSRRYYPAPVDDEPAASSSAQEPSTGGGSGRPLPSEPPAMVSEWLDGLRPAARAELSGHDVDALLRALRGES
jgi:predicted transcriptional regulator